MVLGAILGSLLGIFSGLVLGLLIGFLSMFVNYASDGNVKDGPPFQMIAFLGMGAGAVIGAIFGAIHYAHLHQNR